MLVALDIDGTLLGYAIVGGTIGGLVRGYSGFGFAMSAVPIMSMGISPTIVVPSVLIHELAIGMFSLKSEGVALTFRCSAGSASVHLSEHHWAFLPYQMFPIA